MCLAIRISLAHGQTKCLFPSLRLQQHVEACSGRGLCAGRFRSTCRQQRGLTAALSQKRGLASAGSAPASADAIQSVRAGRCVCVGCCCTCPCALQAGGGARARARSMLPAHARLPGPTQAASIKRSAPAAAAGSCLNITCGGAAYRAKGEIKEKTGRPAGAGLLAHLRETVLSPGAVPRLRLALEAGPPAGAAARGAPGELWRLTTQPGRVQQQARPRKAGACKSRRPRARGSVDRGAPGSTPPP